MWTHCRPLSTGTVTADNPALQGILADLPMAAMLRSLLSKHLPDKAASLQVRLDELSRYFVERRWNNVGEDTGDARFDRRPGKACPVGGRRNSGESRLAKLRPGDDSHSTRVRPQKRCDHRQGEERRNEGESPLGISFQPDQGRHQARSTRERSSP